MLPDDREPESSPLPDFATRRGLEIVAVDIEGVKLGEAVALTALSPGLTAEEPLALFAPRNFWFTFTALNDIGFFAVDELRICPSSADLALRASLSDPPLALPSAEGNPSSDDSGFGVERSSLAVSFTKAGLLGPS